MGADNIFIINSFLFFVLQIITCAITYKAKKISKIDGLLHFFIGALVSISFMFSLYLHTFFTGNDTSIFLRVDSILFIFTFISFLLTLAFVIKKAYIGGSKDV